MAEVPREPGDDSEDEEAGVEEAPVLLADALRALDAERGAAASTAARDRLRIEHRAPPHAMDAERAVLGAMLLDPSAADVAVDEGLAEGSFYRKHHGTIFSAIASLRAKGEPADTMTVCDELMLRGKLEEVGGAAAISQLEALLPTTAHVASYARIVRDKATLRGVIAASTAAVANAFAQDKPTGTILEEMRAALNSLETTGRAGGVRNNREVARALTARIPGLGGVRATMPTGFAALDKVLGGGLTPGSLTVIAGRPSMGKSEFTLNITTDIVMERRQVVHFASLEMPAEDLFERIAGRRCDIDTKRETLTPREQSALNIEIGALGDSPYRVDDTPTQSLGHIRAEARRIHREGNLACVAVDYLQIMGAADDSASRGRSRRGGEETQASAIGEMTKGLKHLARELEIPVIVLSQLNRSLEQRQNKRPMMSDLRECFAVATTTVIGADGVPRPIGGVLGGDTVVAPAGGEVATALITDAWGTGRKAVLRVVTRTGREIRVTPNHPLLTVSGWVPVEALTVGMRIGVPRRLPEPANPVDVTHEEARLLGYLVSDGGYAVHQSVTYCKADPALLADVTSIARARFGITAKSEHRGGTTYDLDLTTPQQGPHRNPLINWLREIGIHGQKGPSKRVPACIFQSSNAVVAEFLGALWAGDGSVVHRKTGGCALKFPSTSRGLLHDVQHLLLRLGIVGVIGRPERNSKSTVDIATIQVRDASQIREFHRQIQVPGIKGGKLNREVSDPPSGRNAHVDRFPLEITEEVNELRRAAGLSHAGLGYRCQGKEMCREDLVRVAGRLGNERLRNLATSDILWDEILSIEPDGEAETMDLRAPTTGAVVASLFCAHNSGAIEQDADVILFLYREEYYAREATPSDKVGEAEVIIGKNRNGPSGVTVKLRFEGSPPRFT